MLDSDVRDCTVLTVVIAVMEDETIRLSSKHRIKTSGNINKVMILLQV